MRFTKWVLMAALIAAPAITIAETPAQAAPNANIAHRPFNQRRRIVNGMRTGQLRPRQAARLERQQRSIHRQMRVMRARHNGRLTMHDRCVLAHRQNAASRRIFRARHNRRNG